jgi:hypothetical protein
MSNSSYYSLAEVKLKINDVKIGDIRPYSNNPRKNAKAINQNGIKWNDIITMVDNDYSPIEEFFNLPNNDITENTEE